MERPVARPQRAVQPHDDSEWVVYTNAYRMIL
jgi:hypothetical protein